MAKKFYRCNVCGDIHYGKNAPDVCPTCGTKDAYEEVDKEQAKKKMGL